MEKIIQAIQATFPNQDVRLLDGQTRFDSVCGWDSMNAVNFQMELEALLDRGTLDFVVTGDMTIQQVIDRVK